MNEQQIIAGQNHQSGDANGTSRTLNNMSTSLSFTPCEHGKYPTECKDCMSTSPNEGSWEERFREK